MSAVEFGSLFEFIRNGMSVKQDKSGEGLPITRIETISDATVDSRRVGYAGLDEAASRRWLLQRGDILFSHINSVEHIGKCAVYLGTPEKLIHGMNLLCLRPDPRRLDYNFAKYLIRSPEFRSRLSNFVNKAVNQASVSIGNLTTIPVSVPPLDEQRRIAAILDQADALRRKRREALGALKRLSSSVFETMFGDLPSNSKGWLPGRVGDLVGGFESGKNLVAEDLDAPDAKHRVLKVSAVTSLSFRPEESKPLPDDYDVPIHHLVREGDLLFSRANTSDLIGATAYVDQVCSNLALPDKIWRFCWPPGSKSYPIFIWYLFRQSAFREQIAKRSTGTSGSMKNISQEKVLGIEIGLPDSEHQAAFSRKVIAIRAMERHALKCAANLDSLFASLQHRAFNGQLTAKLAERELAEAG